VVAVLPVLAVDPVPAVLAGLFSPEVAEVDLPLFDDFPVLPELPVPPD